MQRSQFNPDIQIKFDQLLQHITQKNSIIQQFLRILRQICDAEIFYSRSLDKFANNISKLMIGKDPLKEVFIIFERAIAAKSEQSMEMANNIKDDMIPFIEKEAIDFKEQNELRGKQKIVKDIRLNMQRKLRNLHVSQNNYRRTYQGLKKYTYVESRSDIVQKQQMQKLFNEKEASLMETINSYNHAIQEYMLHYSDVCEKLSDIQTKRKINLRDAVNKFMIFETSCIKNIEYNIPRYMKSLEKMNDRLIIQDKVGNLDPNTQVINLAKISIPNYIANLNDRDQIDIPNTHKKILDIKKQAQNTLSNPKYHQLVAEIYVMLDETIMTYDIRVLKEIVYFSKNVHTFLIRYNEPISPLTNGTNPLKSKPDTNSSVQKQQKMDDRLLLFDSIMCHKIFQNNQFWGKYEQKLFDIIDRQNRSLVGNSQTKQIQISLNFLTADIDFLKIVSYHSLPANILSKFNIVSEQREIPPFAEQNTKLKEVESYVRRNERLLE